MGYLKDAYMGILIFGGIAAGVFSTFISNVIGTIVDLVSGNISAAGSGGIAILKSFATIPFASQILSLRGLEFFGVDANTGLGVLYIAAGFGLFIFTWWVIYWVLKHAMPTPIKNFVLGVKAQHVLISLAFVLLIIIVGSVVEGHPSLNPVFGFQALASHSSNATAFHNYLTNEIESYNGTITLIGG